jgi:cob(I)alamin adenosyltransferase
MARIYTRKGDEGETSLFDGTRTTKNDARVDLYGGVDELNSWLGFCAAQLDRATRDSAGGVVEALAGLVADLHRLQGDLLAMGAILADPIRSASLAACADEPLPFSDRVIEEMIDRLDAELPRLRSFVLPGGHEAAAALQLARTVCRRVERQAVNMAGEHVVPVSILATLNRLSDFLFVAARWANFKLGRADTIWQPDPGPSSAEESLGDDDS